MKNLSLANRWGIIMVLISVLGFGLSIIAIKLFGQYSAIAGFISMPFTVFSFVITVLIELPLASLHPILENILIKECYIMSCALTTTGYILHIIIYIGSYFFLGKIIGKIIEQRKKIGGVFNKIFKPEAINHENLTELKSSYNKITLIALTFSIISIKFYLVGIIALIFGIIALIQIKKTQEKGKTLAIIAIIISLIWGVGLGLVMSII
ncbi:DUF4190 domain-containing protein [bacterium]|nr:DUF4190 domain-containing protein [bacterium]